MKKEKVGVYFASTLLIILMTSNSLSAGNNEDPEITDEEDNIFNYIDAKSGWFYEHQDEPEYLFISLKLVDLSDHIGTVYAIHWNLHNIHYDVSFRNGVMIPRNPKIQWGCHYYEKNPIMIWREHPVNTWNDSACTGEFDTKLNIITWKIHKDLIGQPQPGDQIIQPFIFTAQRISKLGLIPFLGPLSYALSDATPRDQGRSYTIQY